jgi:hypothetical protein
MFFSDCFVDWMSDCTLLIVNFIHSYSNWVILFCLNELVLNQDPKLILFLSKLNDFVFTALHFSASIKFIVAWSLLLRRYFSVLLQFNVACVLLRLGLIWAQVQLIWFMSKWVNYQIEFRTIFKFVRFIYNSKLK